VNDVSGSIDRYGIWLANVNDGEEGGEDDETRARRLDKIVGKGKRFKRRPRRRRLAHGALDCIAMPQVATLRPNDSIGPAKGSGAQVDGVAHIIGESGARCGDKPTNTHEEADDEVKTVGWPTVAEVGATKRSRRQRRPMLGARASSGSLANCTSGQKEGVTHGNGEERGLSDGEGGEKRDLANASVRSIDQCGHKAAKSEGKKEDRGERAEWPEQGAGDGANLASFVGEKKEGADTIRGDNKGLVLKRSGGNTMDGGLSKTALASTRCSWTDSDSQKEDRETCSNRGSGGSNSGTQLTTDSGCEPGDRLLAALSAGRTSTGPGVLPCPDADASKRYLADLEKHVQSFLVHGSQVWQPAGWGGPGAMSMPVSVKDQLLTSTLEYYFSETNLNHDSYLKNLMAQGQGWVPLVVLQAFPRMQKLGVDICTMGQAFLRIATLELDATAYFVRIRDRATREKWIASSRSQMTGWYRAPVEQARWSHP